MDVNAVSEVERGAEILNRIREEIHKVIVGQQDLVEQVMVALLAEGHVLVEGVPGLGKTLLVRALARTINADFTRIQFTPDLMPSDITGHDMYDMNKGKFEIRKGPVFTNLLLADEINRAPAKTQAALLEVMQEKQVTLEGQSLQTGIPFMVLATQNPIEQDGTYPLPEAELDRFIMKVLMDYPGAEEETRLAGIYSRTRSQLEATSETVNTVAEKADITDLQLLARKIEAADEVLEYAVRIVRATRDWYGIVRGAGPRATLALVSCGKAMALIDGQGFVTPDHIKRAALPVLRHRLLLSAELAIEGIQEDEVIKDLLSKVEAPKPQ